MNQFCINCEDTFSSPLLKERNKSLGRNFLFTVLAFAALCAVSYLIYA
jgi:fatty acid desaturase